MGKILKFVKLDPANVEAASVLDALCQEANATDMTTSVKDSTEDDDAFDETSDRVFPATYDFVGKYAEQLGPSFAAQLVAEHALMYAAEKHGVAAMVGALCEVLRALEAKCLVKAEAE
jgi:hypothetical protein